MRNKNNFTNINLLLTKLNSYAEDNKYIKTLNLVIQNILINSTQKLFLINYKIGDQTISFH